jgi:ABC-type multidrug transport system ATPase subunit
MTNCISISNLRNIKSLEFTIPQQGAWLLTAGNGAGKTSLLACLRRIGQANAFPVHFPASAESENLDDFTAAAITYRLGDKEVEYAYRGARWAPRPRANSGLLSAFGYPEVIYIGANADRITPRPEDFTVRRVKSAPSALIDAANKIFETKKFDNLKIINLSRGGGNQAFLLKVADSPAKYHSEKNFSLGELCILKLIEEIRDCKNQSLILIDELEMALHPRAQVQLYRYLEGAAKVKNLTIIFSTHSVSLLKTVPRSQIIFLDKDDKGTVTTVQGCFPAFAVGNITLGEERAPDVVLYVEDEVAKTVLESLVQLSLRTKFSSINLFPDVRVIPIGDFKAVVQFLHHHRAMMPERTRSFAILDRDVKEETLVHWRSSNDHKHLGLFEKLKHQIDYLPWTPEVGILNFLRNRQHAESMIREDLGRPAFVINQIAISSADSKNGKPLRDAAKKIVTEISENISSIMGLTPDEGKRRICQIFSRDEYSRCEAQILGLLLPKLS